MIKSIDGGGARNLKNRIFGKGNYFEGSIFAVGIQLEKQEALRVSEHETQNRLEETVAKLESKLSQKQKEIQDMSQKLCEQNDQLSVAENALNTSEAQNKKLDAANRVLKQHLDKGWYFCKVWSLLSSFNRITTRGDIRSLVEILPKKT